MNNRIVQLLEEVLQHLSSSQGHDLKDSLDQDKMMKETPPDLSLPEEGKPKGISIEKLSVMPKPKSFDDKAEEAIESVDQENKETGDMSDDELSELEELLRKSQALKAG